MYNVKPPAHLSFKMEVMPMLLGGLAEVLFPAESATVRIT